MAVGNFGNHFGNPNKGFSGSTIREIDLIRALGPHQMYDLGIIMEAWAAKRYGYGLSDILDKKASVRLFDGDNEYYWNLTNESNPLEPLLYAFDEYGTEITPTSTGMVGKNNARFKIVTANHRWFKGDVIMGQYREYLMRVIEEPHNEGTNVAYFVEPLGNGVGIPAACLLPGTMWAYLTAPREREQSRKQGGIEFSTSSKMSGRWIRLRQDLKMTGNMLDNRVNVANLKDLQYTDPDTGKVVKGTANQRGFVPMAVAEWTAKWKRAKSNALLYSMDNMDENGEYKNYGEAGSTIQMAPGLYEQMSWGHEEYYSDLKAVFRKIENKLMDMCAGRVAPSERNFIITTGEFGAAAFSKHVQDIASGWTQYEYDGNKMNIVSKVGASHVTNGQSAFRAAAPVYTEYVFGTSIHVSVVVDPSYDALGVGNVLSHPNGGTVKSYQFDIMDLGSASQPNILLCKIKGREENDWMSRGMGVRDPFTGNTKVPYAMTDEDSGWISVGWTGGVCVLDPTRCCSFKPNMLNPSNI